MGKRARLQAGEDLAEEAARIMCEQSMTDYRAAKQKAATRLGLGPRAALPDNIQVERAIIEYQRIFGGEPYRRRLSLLRVTAIKAMVLLAAFDPRLVGATVSGSITDASRVQLHVFSDAPEIVDIFLQNQRLEIRQDERDYRFTRGQPQTIPLARFEAGEVGVDVAIFGPEGMHQAPLSPVTGRTVKRLNLAEVRALLASDA